jgi:hypothetical protein
MNGLFFFPEVLPFGFLVLDAPGKEGFLWRADCGLALKKACQVFFNSPVVRKGSASLHHAAFSTST